MTALSSIHNWFHHDLQISWPLELLTWHLTQCWWKLNIFRILMFVLVTESHQFGNHFLFKLMKNLCQTSMANFLENQLFQLINEIFVNRSPTEIIQLLRINPFKNDIQTSKGKGPSTLKPPMGDIKTHQIDQWLNLYEPKKQKNIQKETGNFTLWSKMSSLAGELNWLDCALWTAP